MRQRATASVRWLTIAAFTVVGVVAALGNELRVQDVDPQYARVIAERTIHYGGTFYQNSIHNKGPLEPFVYMVATWFTTYDGAWFAISILVALISLLLAWAAFSTARLTGGSRPLALAVGVALFIHLTLSGADYAGVLYARNMISALLAGAWLLTLAERPWSPRWARTSAVATGVLLGLAVQTVITTGLSAGVVLLVALGMQTVRFADRERQRRLARTTVGAAAVTFLSAPLYYAVRGSWTEFWEGWWVQARDMSVGTGRSLANQFGLGLHQLGAYYQRRPLALFVVLAFVAFTGSAWGERDRRFRLVHGGLIGWFVAAWVELILSQRYSSHYFIVSTLPTAVMAAALAGHAYRAATVPRRRSMPAEFAWPLIVLVLAVYLSGTGDLMDATRAASGVTSPHQTADDRSRNMGGNERTTLAVLDLVSRRDDALLTWSNEAWPYLKYHRQPATRFIWKSFLMGEIYLGRTSTSYVLPHSWKWFAEDVARTRPVAFVETNARERGTPFDRLITTRFEPVMTLPAGKVYLRRDVADDVVARVGTRPWSPPSNADAGWTVDGNRAAFAGDEDAAGVLPLVTHSCVRVTGQVTGTGTLRFQFTDNAGRAERLHLTLTPARVSSGSDAVEYFALPSGSTGGLDSFSLVIGRRAAVLVVDGEIRGALRLTPSVSVRVRAAGGPVELRDLHLGQSPRRSGC